MLWAAIGASGAAVALYCLLKDDTGDNSTASASSSKKVDGVSKKVLLQILAEIMESQGQMKRYTKELSKELREKPLTFEETYAKVKEVELTLPDPLEKYSMTMLEFDAVLANFEDDPDIKSAMQKVMGAPDAARMA